METLVDVIAVFAALVGVATTLGFGAVQINGGISYLLDVPNNFLVQLLIIFIVTFLFIMSAWSGLSKGIKYLSNINMVLACVLLILMFTHWIHIAYFKYVYRHNRLLYSKSHSVKFPDCAA